MLNMYLWHIHYSLDLALHSKSVAYKLDCDVPQCECFHMLRLKRPTCQSCRGQCQSCRGQYKRAVPDPRAVAADTVGNMCLYCFQTLVVGLLDAL